jgi:hypothetical protein
MANVVLHLKDSRGGTCTMHVDEDQLLKVPITVDKSKKKRAGDIVPGECVFHERWCYTVVDPTA